MTALLQLKSPMIGFSFFYSPLNKMYRSDLHFAGKLAESEQGSQAYEIDCF